MEKLRFGIISTASIVPRFVKAVEASDDSVVSAVASRSADKAAEFAKEHDIPKSYGSYEELLADDGIDVVYVATINSLHYKYAKLALEHEKHVVCEKPLTLKHSEALELFKLAREKGRFLVEAQKAVFLPVMRDVRQTINSGKLGKARLVDTTSSFDAVYNDWMYSPEHGGGPLYGNAIYALQISRFLFGMDVSASSGLLCYGGQRVEEQCALNFTLGSDILVVCKISTTVSAINKAVIYCDLGYIEIPDFWKAREATIFYNDGSVDVIEHPCEHEMVYEINHFSDCIRTGLIQSPIMDEEMTLQSLRVIEALKS